MLSSYCWGERLTLYKILSETPQSVTVDVDGNPRTIPAAKVWGRCEWPYAVGDRVRVHCGVYWCPGSVVGPLRVELDRGGTVPVWNLNVVRPINESVKKQVDIIEIVEKSIIREVATQTIKIAKEFKPKLGKVRNTCDFCTSPSTLLCDGRIAGRSCDRPVCRNCATQVGLMHVSMRPRSKSYWDAVDWCPDCVIAKQLTKQSQINTKGELVKEVSNSTVESDLDHIEPVPMPALEDYEADEMALAQQYDLLEPLKEGDRVRVVLAGPPLEHLTGLLGTSTATETFGLIPVAVDGHGVKILRREQLDLVEASGSMGISIDPEAIFHSQVRHKKRWPGKSGSSWPLVPT